VVDTQEIRPCPGLKKISHAKLNHVQRGLKLDESAESLENAQLDVNKALHIFCEFSSDGNDLCDPLDARRLCAGHCMATVATTKSLGAIRGQ